jgi:hypothetical protein
MIRLTDLSTYRKARALGLYWDSIVRRQAAPAKVAPPAADELVDFIHDLHRAWDPGRRTEPTDDPELNDLLAKHQEMNAMATTASYLAKPAVLHRPPSLSAVRPTPMHQLPTSVRNRLPALLAASLLIILTGVLATRSWLESNGPGPRGGPVIYAPATPTDETLFEISIPAEFLPTGESNFSGLSMFTLPAGTSSKSSPTCCSGTAVQYVISGAITVKVPDDSQSIVRADGTVEEVPANTEVMMGPGDAMFGRFVSDAFFATTTGAEPADVLAWVLTDKSPTAQPTGMVQGPMDEQFSVRTMAGPMAVTLRRIAVADGDVIPALSGAASLHLAVSHPEYANVEHGSDGSIAVSLGEDETATLYYLTATQSGSETLMEFEIPAEMLPTGDATSAGIVRLEVPVGSSETWTPTCCTGPLVEYVVSGEYTVRAQDQITVFRADGTAEEIAAGAAVTLGAGDGLLSRNQTVAQVSNTGTTPVDLLQWVMIDNTSAFNEHKLPGWVKTNTQVVRYFSPEEGPVTVTLRRVEVQGIAEIPKPAEGISYQYGLPSVPRQVVIGDLTDGLKVYGGEGETNAIYVLTTTQSDTESGTPEA